MRRKSSSLLGVFWHFMICARPLNTIIFLIFTHFYHAAIGNLQRDGGRIYAILFKDLYHLGAPHVPLSLRDDGLRSFL